MFVNSIPVTAVAASTWANATRTLTKLGPALNTAFDVGALRDQNSGVSNAFSAWVEILTSLTRDSVLAFVSGDVYNNGTLVPACTVQLGIGAGGSEVIIGQAITRCYPAAAGDYFIEVMGNFPAGTRFAMRASSETATAGVYDAGLTVS